MLNVNASSQTGHQPLHYAIINGSIEITQLLLDHHADVNASDNRNVTPLYLAIEHGHIQVMKILLGRGARMSSGNRTSSMSPLHLAAEHNHIQIMQFFLDTDEKDKKIAVNAVTPDGKTPLHFAAIHGHIEATQLLLDHHADVNTADESGMTPLHYAVWRGRHDLDIDICRGLVIQCLLQHHADVTMVDRYHKTPLDYAKECNKTKTIQLLEDHIAAQQLESYDASRNGNIKTVQSLLKEGIDIETKDKAGLTVLQIAAKNGQFESVELLLKNGANFHATTRNNETALDLALRYRCLNLGSYDKHTKVVELLTDLSTKEQAKAKIRKMATTYFENKNRQLYFIKKVEDILQQANQNLTSACKTAYEETTTRIIVQTANELPFNEQENFIKQAMILSKSYIEKPIKGTFEQEVVIRTHHLMVKLDEHLNKIKHSISKSKHLQSQFVDIARKNIYKLSDWNDEKTWSIETDSAEKFILEKEKLMQFLQDERNRIGNDPIKFTKDKMKTQNKVIEIQQRINALKLVSDFIGLRRFKLNLSKNHYFTQGRGFFSASSESTSKKNFEEKFNKVQKISPC